MSNNGEKRFMPSSNPDWDLELPDGDDNSLVTKDGKSWDNGYNFDEKDDDEKDTPEEFDPAAAQKAREEAIKEKSQD
ncbi:hypothetical protein IKG33_01680 [Candidatus Saccharibacteria bacterium]|nr:hypothetical protein [Candidatus Saccharibacteria bacterium]